MRVLLLAALAALLACASETKASTGRTERATASVIAHSTAPGAAATRKAMDVADSGRARVAREDSAGQ